MKHVRHVTRPIGDPPTLGVLDVCISPGTKKIERKDNKKKKSTCAERMNRVSAELSIHVSLSRIAMDERTQWL
jgi:hypothetical protein